MRTLVFLIIILMGFIAHAVPTKGCFCEIGQQPAAQQGIFSLGCSRWLAEQTNCAFKKEVPHGTHYTQFEFEKNIVSLSIGYVGHWSNSAQMVTYLHTRISPLLERTALSISIDNTACKAMNEPGLVVDHIRTLSLRKNQILKVRGNQTQSVGKWDTLFGKENNFYAVVSSAHQSVIYPTCLEYEDHPCLQGIQLNDEATCVASNYQLKKLRCCLVPESPYNDGPKFIYHWRQPNNCY